MKKFLFIAALTLISGLSYGQSTDSRQTAFGQQADVANWRTTVIADTAGATEDTVRLRPHAQFTYYKVNLLDSAILDLKSTAGCYYGDKLYLDIINPAFTGEIILSGRWIVSTGTTTIALTASKSSLLEFWFNGIDFVETSRNMNYTR